MNDRKPPSLALTISVIGNLLGLCLLVGFVVAAIQLGRLETSSRRGDALCSAVRFRLDENLKVLRGPQTGLQLDLLQTIGSDRFSDGADALSLCTKVDVEKIAMCRATNPDTACLIGVLEAGR